MSSQKCNILLILQQEENKRTNLYDFLIEQDFDVFHSENVQGGIQKARDCFPELIICQNDMGEKSGLQIYKTLHPDLIKKGTSFFLYLDEYSKEDVLIGLEMGVDNFIFLPFDEKALTRKIENQLGKARQSRILDSENFKQQFESTPVAKFVANGNQIVMMNPAFEKLTGFKNEKDTPPKIDDIFDFSEKEHTLINYRKCMNGLKDLYLFQSVLSKTNNFLRFDIHLVQSDYMEDGLFMAEVLPANGFHKDENIPDDGSNTGFRIPLNGNRYHLTVREKEVLEWSAQGLPIKQIASVLHISERTVEKHRANIMSKTQTNSIVEALYAIRRKMEE